MTTTLAYIPGPAQGVWQLGPLPLRAYALFIIVGIVAALVIGDRRWEARGGERGVIYDIALWAVPFGLIGGRVYHVITDWGTYFGSAGAGFGAALRIWDGGLGIWGAVAFGGVGAWIASRRRDIPLPAFGDAIAPGIVLAQAIGRLGNYFNQELYGRATTLPWGLEIYERRDASGALDSLNGVSTGQLVEVVHPAFLYELLWNLLVFAILIWVDRRYKIGHGRLFALYVASYCVGRFWIELMRSDVATQLAGIRINSFTSTFVFIGAVVYIMAAPKGREDPATLQSTPEKIEARGELAEDEAEDEDDTSVEDFVKELASVAAPTGVVAAATVAGEGEDEDAQAAAGDDAADQFQPDVSDGGSAEQSEAAAEAEALAEEVAEAPAEEIAGAEEFAAAGEAADAEVAEAADEDESAEGDEAAEGDERPVQEPESGEAEQSEGVTTEAEAEPGASDDVGGVGAVEGEEAVEAEEAAAEAHEAAVAGVADAEDVADAESVADEVEGEESDAESATEIPADEAAEVKGDDAIEAREPDTEAEGVADEAEPDGSDDVGGVGAVEGEDAVQADEAAAEAHEAARAGVAEAEGVADEVAAEESETGNTDEAAAEESDAEAAEEAVEPKEAPPAAPPLPSQPQRRWWQRFRQP